MAEAQKMIARVREAGESGRLTEADVALLEDVVNGGNPGWDRWVSFACDYLPEAVGLSVERVRPGLLADSDDIEAAKQRLEIDPVSKAAWKALETNCREIMSPDSSRYLEYEERAQKHIWGRRQGHWLTANAIEHLGWAYRLSGDRAYGEYARGILLAIAETRHGWGPMFCNYGTPYKGWLTDNSLDLGHATLPFAVGYDLIHDLLSEDDRKTVADYYEPYFHRLLGLRYECVRQMPANSPIIGHCGVGLMALSLSDAYPEARRDVLTEVVRSARAYAVCGLDRAIKEDGACVEGSGYSSASMHYMAVFSEGLRRVTGVNLFEHPTWRRNPVYLCCEMLPGGAAINNYNDNHYDGVTTGYWLMAARQTGDPVGPWVWENFSGPKGSGELHRGGGTIELPYILINRDPSIVEATPQEMGIQPVHHFDRIQHLVMRTGWEADDSHVTFQCTPYEKDVSAHAQADRLNFTMYASGERFVVDSGYGLLPIPGSTQVQRFGKLGESHNQVRIDGKAQEITPAQEGTGGYCKVEQWAQSGEWVWAVGDATAFYDGAVQVKRGIATRLSAEAPLVLLVDVVVPSPGSHGFDWLLQTEEGNEISIDNDRIQLTGHRKGGTAQVAQAANLATTWDQDEWITHPRLIGRSEGPYLVALTAIGMVGEVEKTVEDGKLGLVMGDAEGRVEANVSWANKDGAPGPASVTIHPAGISFEVG